MAQVSFAQVTKPIVFTGRYNCPVDTECLKAQIGPIYGTDQYITGYTKGERVVCQYSNWMSIYYNYFKKPLKPIWYNIFEDSTFQCWFGEGFYHYDSKNNLLLFYEVKGGRDLKIIKDQYYEHYQKRWFSSLTYQGFKWYVKKNDALTYPYVFKPLQFAGKTYLLQVETPHQMGSTFHQSMITTVTTFLNLANAEIALDHLYDWKENDTIDMQFGVETSSTLDKMESPNTILIDSIIIGYKKIYRKIPVDLIEFLDYQWELIDSVREKTYSQPVGIIRLGTNDGLFEGQIYYAANRNPYLLLNVNKKESLLLPLQTGYKVHKGMYLFKKYPELD